MMHELSHNFDESNTNNIRHGASWNFHGEFFANLKVGYTMCRRNAFYYRGYGHWVIGILGYMDHFRAYHSRQMASGRFCHDAMTYGFLSIQRVIGWEPFRRTFRHFNSLTHDNFTQTHTQKFELFINRLSHYSGRNVANILTPQEMNIYRAAMNYFDSLHH